MTAIARALGSIILVAMAAVTASSAAHAASRSSRFVLANGMELVVIPDGRAPVVTHALAYRVGASDDPAGISGVAHFLEHLMYKATASRPSGSFSRAISRLGGHENAVTTHDTTIYHQRVPKEALASVMALEADRWGSIRFDADEALRERAIVTEERRQRIDLSPLNILNEMISKTLYEGHPYGRPVLGWPGDIAQLTAEHAKQFYQHHYTPANTVLVVMGDIEPDAVRALAEAAYGAIPSGAAAERRAGAPDAHAGRVELRDKRVTSPAVVRAMFAAIPSSSRSGDAEALEILLRVLAQGETSRLHRRLVETERLAIVVEGGTSPTRLGLKLALYAVARPGADLRAIEAAIDAEVEAVIDRGITADELANARSIIAAADLFESDKQSKLALRYAERLASGETIDGIEGRPERLQAVTEADVRRVARAALARGKAVTGRLLPASDVSGEAR